MSTPYDFRQDSIRRDLDAAFAAGERRGREWADEHLTAECVELRVAHRKAEVAAYHQGIETAMFLMLALAAVIVTVASVTWWLL